MLRRKRRGVGWGGGWPLPLDHSGDGERFTATSRPGLVGGFGEGSRAQQDTVPDCSPGPPRSAEAM